MKVGSVRNDQLDPVDYAVVSQGLIATAREMGVKLVRSAYSTLVREAADASAALLDREGNVVAQAELIPMQLGPMAEIFKACVNICPVADLHEGDFYINNDPYGGGQHLQDVFIFSPIFSEGVLIGFSASVAHHIDLGGGNPGLTVEAADVHAEGIIFPPSRYNYERDWNGGPFERLVAANIRVPALTIGDLNAQFAANAIGAERLRQLVQKYGIDVTTSVMQELIEYSERRCRAAVRAVPDGTYFGEDAVDDDGITEEPLVVKATVTVSGDSIAVDFAGTCDQVSRNLNCPFSSTLSATITAIKATLTSPDIPFNEGLKRPLSVKAPKGSLVNPNYPAPVRARMEAGYRCYNAVMRALAQVVPKQVIAGGNDTTLATSLSFLDPDRGYRVYIEVSGGGYGASTNVDGCDAVDAPLSNCSNTPIEATDMDYAYFRVVGYGLRPDSCGHGKHRGGLGLFRRYEILRDGVNFATYGDRFRLPPYGLFGGSDAACTRSFLERDGNVIEIQSKDSMLLRKGDFLTLETSGGGGYGDASMRAHADVAHDVSQGYLSGEAARAAYGWSDA